MLAKLLMVVLGLLAGATLASAESDPVLGFGEHSRGGAGGRVLMVTRKDDDPQHPKPGSLRWAFRQRGARIVKFAVRGDVVLQDRIIIREPFLTVDGSDAPDGGVCIRNGSLMFRETHDVIVRQVRIRLGEGPARRQRREYHAKRPPHSAGLDCVSLDDSWRIVFDHCSLSWSCDEIFGITHCQDVTIQWCLLSYPLANRKLHPYGDNHAFPINASASTLSVHHCLMAHYVMRGPQFEANDVRPEDRFTVKMEAVNNVMFDYERSGSRYSSGVEKGNGTAKGKAFQFEFLNNVYLCDSSRKPPLEAISKHGFIPQVKVHESRAVLEITRWRTPAVTSTISLVFKGEAAVRRLPPSNPVTETATVDSPFWTDAEDSSAQRGQVSARRLFVTTASRDPQVPQQAAEAVLQRAGCAPRDALDRQVVEDVRERRFGKVAHHEPGPFHWLDFLSSPTRLDGAR